MQISFIGPLLATQNIAFAEDQQACFTVQFNSHFFSCLESCVYVGGGDGGILALWNGLKIMCHKNFSFLEIEI